MSSVEMTHLQQRRIIESPLNFLWWTSLVSFIICFISYLFHSTDGVLPQKTARQWYANENREQFSGEHNNRTVRATHLLKHGHVATEKFCLHRIHTRVFRISFFLNGDRSRFRFEFHRIHVQSITLGPSEPCAKMIIHYTSPRFPAELNLLFQ